jgi:hypothetical protein
MPLFANLRVAAGPVRRRHETVEAIIQSELETAPSKAAGDGERLRPLLPNRVRGVARWSTGV